MKGGWFALVLGITLIIPMLSCTKQVAPADAQTIKLVIPNLMGG
jgi:hypothetical protein